MIGLGLLGASRMSQLWHFYIANLAIGTGLICGTIIPCSALISNWFVSRRGTAMAVSFAGTAVGGLVMGAMVLGKLAVGPVIDRWGSSRTMAVSSVLFALSYVIFIHADQYQIVMMFAGLYGFSLGAPLALNPLLTSDHLGMKHFGGIFGVLSIMGLVGGSIGPVIAGKVFDAQESYLLILHSSIGLSLLSATLCVFLAQSSRGRGREGDRRSLVDRKPAQVP